MQTKLSSLCVLYIPHDVNCMYAQQRDFPLKTSWPCECEGPVLYPTLFKKFAVRGFVHAQNLAALFFFSAFRPNDCNKECHLRMEG